MTTNCYIFNANGEGCTWSDLNTTWATVHDQTSGYAGNTDADADIKARLRPTTLDYQIWRGFFPFDCTGIPDEATVTDVKFYVYCIAAPNSDNDAQSYIQVIGPTTQASTTNLVGDDLDQCGGNVPTATEKCSDAKTVASFNTSAWNYFTLDADGIVLVQAGIASGVVMLGLREGHDIEDSAPNVQNNAGTGVTIASTESDNDPYLEVTYTIPDVNATPSAESVTTAESITMETGPLTYDAATLTETIVVNIVSLINMAISTAQAITLAEAITIALEAPSTLFIDNSESIILTESISAFNPDILVIHQSESVAVTELTTIFPVGVYRQFVGDDYYTDL